MTFWYFWKGGSEGFELGSDDVTVISVEEAVRLRTKLFFFFALFSFQHTHSLQSWFLHFSTLHSYEYPNLQLINNNSWCSSIMSMQREKMAKKSIGSLMRKKLSDITNNTNPNYSQQLDTTLSSDNNSIQQLLKVHFIYLLFVLYFIILLSISFLNDFGWIAIYGARTPLLVQVWSCQTCF